MEYGKYKQSGSAIFVLAIIYLVIFHSQYL